MPETTEYLLLGIAVVLLLMSLFIASLIARRRNLKRDWALLQELQADE